MSSDSHPLVDRSLMVSSIFSYRKLTAREKRSLKGFRRHAGMTWRLMTFSDSCTIAQHGTKTAIKPRFACYELRFAAFVTFATWGNSGIEPDEGKGISSPGTYEAILMWPRSDGERQWNTMSD